MADEVAPGRYHVGADGFDLQFSAAVGAELGRIRELGLWKRDAEEARVRAFAAHDHADHAARPGEALRTERVGFERLVTDPGEAATDPSGGLP